MHAVERRKYGTPDVLAYEVIARPVPGKEDVLVHVHAAGASIGDHISVIGKPYLIRLTPFGGIPRPRNPVPGACMAGRIGRRFLNRCVAAATLVFHGDSSGSLGRFP